jgi:predicted nuclease of predicted toxin-antitoxin system
MADLYLDHDVAIRLAPLLTRAGHSVRTTRDEGLETARDPRQLLFATRHGRIIISHNKKDFRLLHDAWQAWGAEWGTWRRHHGILILDHGDVEILAVAVHQILSRGVQTVNQMYEWGHTSGWRLRPAQ